MEVYNVLLKLSTGFEDTPDRVLRRVLKIKQAKDVKKRP